MINHDPKYTYWLRFLPFNLPQKQLANLKRKILGLSEQQVEQLNQKFNQFAYIASCSIIAIGIVLAGAVDIMFWVKYI